MKEGRKPGDLGLEFRNYDCAQQDAGGSSSGITRVIHETASVRTSHHSNLREFGVAGDLMN